jgi:hypothetical protein
MELIDGAYVDRSTESGDITCEADVDVRSH